MSIKIIFGGLLASLLLIAQPAIAQGHKNDGLFGGVDGSYDLHNDNTELLATKISFEGGAAGVFVGYRQTNNKFSVAVEARYGYGFASYTNITNGASLEATHEFELAAMPGYWITDDLLIYARLGATNNTIRVSTAATSTSTNTNTNFNYGGGIELNLNNNWSVRVEYTRSEIYDEQLTFTAPLNFWRVKRDRLKGAAVFKF